MKFLQHVFVIVGKDSSSHFPKKKQPKTTLFVPDEGKEEAKTSIRNII